MTTKRNYVNTLKHTVSIPFIFAPFIPTLITHVFMWFYQFVCFPIFGLPKVRFKDYFLLDRSKLNYLSTVEKFNCTYCSYANGVFMYMAEIAHRTEHYWCGIKHQDHPNNPAFAYQEKFAKYGSKSEYKVVLKTHNRI